MLSSSEDAEEDTSDTSDEADVSLEVSFFPQEAKLETNIQIHSKNAGILILFIIFVSCDTAYLRAAL